MNSILENIQNACTERLSQCGILRGIPIMKRVADVKGFIEEASRHAEELWVLVDEPVISKAVNSGTNLEISMLDITVYIYESIFSTHRQRSALAVAETVLRALYHWSPAVDGATSAIKVAENSTLTRDTSQRAKGYNIIDLRLYIEASLPAWQDLG